MRTVIFIFLLIIFFGSCSNEQPAKEIPAVPQVIADSLFAFHNIRSTDELPGFWYDENDHFQPYTDSTKKVKLVRMDSVMKKKILIPLLDIDPSYVVQFMDAIYVSKQDSIGPYTPIIVNLSGDDYDELLFILLDDKCDPVSKFSLRGGEWTGPDQTDENGVIHISPLKQSYFSHDTIHSYVLHVSDHPYDQKKLSDIDSITFISTIGTNGQFTTVKKDSTRYQRFFIWP